MEYARTVSDGDFAGARALLSRWVDPQLKAGTFHQRADDGFSLAVGDYLQSLGRTVASATQEDAFGLDFAIEHPKTGLYAIGIECDAPRHELLGRARAREVWRPNVLRRAVPVIHRVSSQGWYHDAETERRRLRDAVDRALEAGGVQ
jgi:hypothetical protein